MRSEITCCKPCRRVASREYYQANREKQLLERKKYRESNLPHALMMGAKGRARKYGWAFGITAADVVIPTHCPLLGIPLFVNNITVGPNSPTLDRIDPSKGYVKGNVMVISHKANSMKNSATFDELETLVVNLRRIVTTK